MTPLESSSANVAGADVLAHAIAAGIGAWTSTPETLQRSELHTGEFLHLPMGRSVDAQRMTDLIHPEDRDQTLRRIKHAANGSGHFECTFRGGGTAALFLRMSALARWVDGRMLIPRGLLIDESPLVAAQARLSMIADSTPALLWIMEPNGFCSFFSQSWYDYTGQTAQEALGMGWLATAHPEDIGLAADRAMQAVRERSAFESIHRLRHKTLGWRWVLCVGKPRFDASGTFLGHCGAVTDIHDRRMWEQRLKTSEETYRQFIAVLPAGIARFEVAPVLDTAAPLEEQADLLLANARLAECNFAFARAMNLGGPPGLVGLRLADLLGSAPAASLVRRIAQRQFGSDIYDWVLPQGAGSARMLFSMENGSLVRFWITLLE